LERDRVGYLPGIGVHKEARMRKGIGFWAMLAVVAGLMALGTSLAGANTTPRWVKHVRSYPGGISAGVRAYLDGGTSSARPGLTATRSARSSSGPASTPALRNLKVNGQDSNPPVPQNETQVAHNEFNDLVAVAGANDYVNGGSQIYRTTDGGQHWSSQFRSARVQETGDFCGGGGDPALTYSRRDHAFYFAQLCFFRAHFESEVEVIQSLDNGRTWTGSRTGAYPISNFKPALDDFNPAVFYDKEQITVDNNPSSPYYGRLYVTYIKFHMQPSGFSDYCPVRVAYTDNIDPNGDGDLQDSVWKHTAVVHDNPGDNGVGPTANQGAQPVVDNQGGLDISYQTEECNTSIAHRILFKRSTTGGASFGATHTISQPGPWQDNPDPDDLLPDKNARMPASTSAPLVFNPVDGSLNYIVQNNVNRALTGADISFTRSVDHGTTWSPMETVSVNGSGEPARNDQFFPWMDVDPDGNLHAIWFDNRRDPGNVRIRTFQGFSADAGTTWSNVNISTRSWDPNQAFFDSGAFIGDYNGLAVGDGVIYPIWTDGRDSPGSPQGQTDIWTNVELNTFPQP
jgi:hypothetical protein